MEGGGRNDEEALEELRYVFNLCDSDQDGVISVEDFRKIGREHFDKTKVICDIKYLLQEGAGHSYTIAVYLVSIGLETQHV